jgi:hypothetical protein
MGGIWLNGLDGYASLVDVARAAGLTVDPYPDWQWRSRSSGGFDRLLGIVCHHTACGPTSTYEGCRSYMVTMTDGPCANMLLSRPVPGRGVVLSVHCGGASNHAGKGGPAACSGGTVPLDQGNQNLIGIEVCNAGTGESWPGEQLDAYERLVAALVGAYDLTFADVMLHATWAPTRKIDPAGPGPGAYCRAPAGTWDLGQWRDACAAAGTAPVDEEDDMQWLYRDSRYSNVFVRGAGPATPVTTEELQQGGVGAKLGAVIVAAHGPTLEAITSQAWGCTVAEAVERRLLV